MSNFTVSQNPPRYRITGMTAQRYALPPSSGVAFGEGLLFGLVGGAVLSLPVALRTQTTLSTALMVWLGATGLYGMLLGLLSASLRVARPLPRRSPALPLGLAFAFGPLAALGSGLHATTHHRPLGAATYAVLAFILVAVCWATAARVWVSLRSPFPKRRLFGMLLGSAFAILSLGCALPMLVAWLRNINHLPLLSSGIMDGLLGVALTVFGGFARFPHKLEAAARTAGPLAFGVCALMFAVALQSPETGPILARASLLWAWLH